MAYDFTHATGNRKSSSARTGGGRIDVGQTSVTRKDTPREIQGLEPDLQGSAALSGLAGALGDFFGQKADAEFAREVREEKVKNAEAIAEMRAKVATNREGARRALETGDFSEFVTDDELRERKVVQQSFTQIVAAEAALMDYDTDYKQAIRETPIEGDPRATIEDALRHNLQGADPIYAETYSNAVLKHVEGDITAWKKSRLTAMVMRAEASISVAAQQAIEKGEITDLKSYHTFLDMSMGSIPLPTPEADSRSRAIGEAMLLKMATQSGDPTAIELLSEPDDRHDGLSIATRRKLDMPVLLEKARQARIAAQSFAAVKSMDDVEHGIQMALNGEKDAPTLDEILLKHREVVEAHGRDMRLNGRYKKLGNQIRTMRKGAMAQMNLVKHAVAGTYPKDVAGSEKAMTAALSSQSFIQEVAAEGGMTIQEAAGRVANMTANMRLNAAGKKNFTQRMLADDPVSQEETFRFLASVESAGGSARNYFSKDNDGDMAFALYTRLQESPTMASTVINRWRAAAEQDQGNDTKDPARYFNELQTADGKSQRGRGGARALVFDVLKQAHDDWFVSDADVEQFVSPAVREDMMRRLNIIAYTFRNEPYNEDKLKADLQRSMQAMYTKRINGPDGETVLDFKHNPRGFGKDPVTGMTVQLTQPTIRDQETQTLQLNEDEKYETFARVNGGEVHVTTDEWTADNMGLAVKNAQGQQIEFLPGYKVPVDKDIAQDPMFANGGLFQFTATSDPDTFVMEVRGIPGETDLLSQPMDHMRAWQYNDRTGTWMLRAGLTPPPATDVATEDKKLQSTRSEAKANVQQLKDEMAMMAKIGLPDPQVEGMLVTPGPVEESTMDKMYEGMLGTLTGNGFAGPEESLKISTDLPRPKPKPVRVGEEDGDLDELDIAIESAVERAKVLNEELGQWTEDATTPMDQKSQTIMSKHIEQYEGFSAFPYDDAEGRIKKAHWGDSKKKGRPTVGFGFNLNRKDAGKLLAEVGLDKNLLMQGQQTMSRQQASRLLDITLFQFRKELKAKLGTDTMAKLSKNQVMGLLSMTYNGGTETMIGPRILAALKAGDWQAASDEIRLNSIDEVGMTARGEGHLINGLRNRRAAEADLFDGAK